MIWVGRKQEGADEKAYGQAKGGSTNCYCCLRADGVSGTTLTNQPRLNKSELTLKVCSGSARRLQGCGIAAAALEALELDSAYR